MQGREKNSDDARDDVIERQSVRGHLNITCLYCITKPFKWTSATIELHRHFRSFATRCLLMQKENSIDRAMIDNRRWIRWLFLCVNKTTGEPTDENSQSINIPSILIFTRNQYLEMKYTRYLSKVMDIDQIESKHRCCCSARQFIGRGSFFSAWISSSTSRLVIVIWHLQHIFSPSSSTLILTIYFPPLHSLIVVIQHARTDTHTHLHSHCESTPSCEIQNGNQMRTSSCG